MHVEKDVGPQPTNPGYETLNRIARKQPGALKALRASVKRVHMQYHPADLITDYEADKIIASRLPETIERMIQKTVDSQS